MRILLVTTVSYTLRFLKNDIKVLKELGYTIDLATNVQHEIENDILKNIEDIYNIEFSRNPLSRKNYIAKNKLKKIINEKCYKAVHTHTPVASFITRAVSKNNSDLKVIYTAHGFHFYSGAPLKNWILFYPIELLAIKWTDALITINEEDYKRALRMSENHHCQVYYVPGVGIETKEFNIKSYRNEVLNNLEVDLSKKVITYVAELNDNKNQILLLEMMKKFKETNSKFHLLLVGTGNNLKSYKKYIEYNSLDNVSLLGYRNDIPQILSATDIYVSPSKREGLPVNVMEAMASGLPIVATDIRGHRDLISDNINGFLVEGKIQDFFEKIEWIENNPKKAELFSINSLKKIKSYDNSRVAMEIREFYRNILRDVF